MDKRIFKKVTIVLIMTSLTFIYYFGDWKSSILYNENNQVVNSGSKIDISTLQNPSERTPSAIVSISTKQDINKSYPNSQSLPHSKGRKSTSNPLIGIEYLSYMESYNLIKLHINDPNSSLKTISEFLMKDAPKIAHSNSNVKLDVLQSRVIKEIINNPRILFQGKSGNEISEFQEFLKIKGETETNLSLVRNILIFFNKVYSPTHPFIKEIIIKRNNLLEHFAYRDLII